MKERDIMALIEVTKETFEQEVLKSEKHIITL